MRVPFFSKRDNLYQVSIQEDCSGPCNGQIYHVDVTLTDHINDSPEDAIIVPVAVEFHRSERDVLAYRSDMETVMETDLSRFKLVSVTYSVCNHEQFLKVS